MSALSPLQTTADSSHVNVNTSLNSLKQLFDSAKMGWPTDSGHTIAVMTQNLHSIGAQNQVLQLSTQHQQLDEVYAEINQLKAHNRKHDPVSDHVKMARLSLVKLLEVTQKPVVDTDAVERVSYAEASVSAALHRAKQKLSQVRSRQKRKKRMRENDVETRPRKKRIVCLAEDHQPPSPQATGLPLPPTRTDAQSHKTKTLLCQPQAQDVTRELFQQMQAPPPSLPPIHIPRPAIHVPVNAVNLNLSDHPSYPVANPSFSTIAQPTTNPHANRMIVKIPSRLLQQQQLCLNPPPTSNFNLASTSCGSVGCGCNGLPQSQFGSYSQHVRPATAQRFDEYSIGPSSFSVPAQQVPSVMPIRQYSQFALHNQPLQMHGGQGMAQPTYKITISHQ